MLNLVSQCITAWHALVYFSLHGFLGRTDGASWRICYFLFGCKEYAGIHSYGDFQIYLHAWQTLLYFLVYLIFHLKNTQRSQGSVKPRMNGSS